MADINQDFNVSAAIRRYRQSNDQSLRKSAAAAIKRYREQEKQQALEGYRLHAQGLGYSQPSAPQQPSQQNDRRDPQSMLGYQIGSVLQPLSQNNAAQSAQTFGSQIGSQSGTGMRPFTISGVGTGLQGEYSAQAMKTVDLYERAAQQAKELQEFETKSKSMQTKQSELTARAVMLQQLRSSYESNPNDRDFMAYQMAYQQYQTDVTQYYKDIASFEKERAAYSGKYREYVNLMQQAEAAGMKADELYGQLVPTTPEQIAAASDRLQQAEIREAQANKKVYRAESRLPYAGSSAGQWAAALPEGDLAAIGDVAAAQREADAAKAAADEARAIGETAAYSEQLLPYRALSNNADFAEKSKFVSRKNGKRPIARTDAVGNTYYAEDGYDLDSDRMYDYINGDEQARAVTLGIEIGSGATFAGVDSSFLQQLTQEEVQIFNYLYATQGAAAAGEFLNVLQSHLNERQRQKEMAAAAASAKESPVSESIFSVLTSPLKGVSAVGQLADYLDDGRIDQNAGYNKFSYQSSAVREEVGKLAEEHWGPVGSFAYNLAMSTGEFLLNTGITGGTQSASLALMGSGAMADTVISGKDRGYSDGEAILLGLIAGGVEAATEKVDIDKLFDMKTLRDSTKRYLVQNVLGEAAEEGISSIVNTAFDLIIAQDQSELVELVNYYQEQGMSASEAWGKAVGDKLLEAGVDALAGLLSGGLMGGGSVAVNSFSRYRAGKRIQNADSSVLDLLDRAKNSTHEETKKLASDLQAQLDGGKTVMELSPLKVGRLAASYWQNVDRNWQPEEAPKAPAAASSSQAASTSAAKTTAEASSAASAPTSEGVSAPKATSESGKPVIWGNKDVSQLEGYGLIRTGDAAEASEDVKAEVQRISSALGREITLFRQTDTSGGIIDGIFDQQTGRMYVNAEAKQPIAVVIGHELTHGTELGDTYQALQELVFRRISKQGNNDLMRQREAIIARYAKMGIDLSNEQANKEIVANYLSQYLLTDPKAIRELVREKPGLGRRILAWIDNLLKKFNKKSRERDFLLRARYLYREALAESDRTRARRKEGEQREQELIEALRKGEVSEDDFDEAMENIRQEYGMSEDYNAQFLYAGEKAGTADLDAQYADSEWEMRTLRAKMVDPNRDYSGMSYERYRNTAGEIEARDAASRRRMSAERRMETAPNIGDENTVFAEPLVSSYDVDLDDAEPASRQESLTLAATDDRNVKRFRSEVDAVLSGAMDSKSLVLLGAPSPVLQKYLQSDRPLYMPQKSVKKAVLSKEAGGKHGLGITVMYDLLYQLDDPMAITGNTTAHAEKGDNSIVVWTDWKTASGASVIVPIKIDADGNVGIYNNVNTVFDAYDETYVADLLRDGNVLYTKNNESIRSLLLQRREVPELQRTNAFNESIRENQPVVNAQFSVPESDAEASGESAEVAAENVSNLDTALDDANDVLRGVPEQAQARLQDAVKSLWKSLRETIAFPIYANNSLLKDAATVIAADVVDNGYLSTEWVERVFDLTYDRLLDAAQDYFEKYSGLSDILRHTRISASEDVQKTFDGYARLKKRANKGILTIADRGGANVNTLYEEVQTRAPELFPASITSEAARLKRLFSVSMDLIRANNLVNDASGNAQIAASIQRAMRNDFVSAAASSHAPLRQISRYAAEQRQRARTFTPLSDETEAATAMQQFEAAKRNLIKAEQNYLLTEQDREVVQQMLSGQKDLNALSSLDPVSAEGIRAVYEARRAYDPLAQQLQEWNSRKAAGGTPAASEPSTVQAQTAPKDVEAVFSPEEAAETLARVPKNARYETVKAASQLANVVSDAVKLPRYGDGEVAKNAANEMLADILTNGSVSQQAIDHAFQTAYDAARENDASYAEQHRELGERLKTTPITVSDDAKKALGFGAGKLFRYASGVLRIVGSDGVNVDQFYEQLSEQHPDLFPRDISNEVSRLKRLYGVSRSILTAANMSAALQTELASSYRNAAYADFETAVRGYTDGLRMLARYVADKLSADAETDDAGNPAKPFEPKIKSLDGLKDAYRDMESAGNALSRIRAKAFLTKSDELRVGELLTGRIQLSDLDPETDNVRGITDVYHAQKQYDDICRDIREWRAARKSKLREAADKLLQDAHIWRDKKFGLNYSRETMERNIRDIVRDDGLAQEIIDTYFTPVHEASAEANRMKNRYRDRVKALHLSRHVRKGDLVSESHAVQLLGEALDNIARLEKKPWMEKMDGKKLADWKAIVADLFVSSPSLNRAKIEGAVEAFRKIYNELFEQMNDARLRNGYEPVNYRKGYFPHFQPQQSGLADLFAKALGIEMSVAELPTSINGLTYRFRPGIQWFGNTLERLGFQTAYDAVEGFDRYIEGASNVIHMTDSIQQFRALADQIRYRSTDQGIREQVDRILKDESLKEEDKELRIKAIYDTAKFALNNFVVELDEYTNKLAGKKSMADRSTEALIGRKWYTIIKNLENRVAANMVALNPGSWLTNFAPLAQGWQDIGRYLFSGMWDTMSNMVRHDDMNERSTFLSNRSGSDPLIRSWQQKTSGILGKPMEWIDHYVSASLVRGRYQQNLKKGLSEDSAIREADAWAAKVMADRSKGAMPTLFEQKNPVSKLFTQFQLEVNNELSYLFKDMPREMKSNGIARAFAIALRFLLGRFIFNDLYEWLLGRRPMLDPLNMILEFAGDWAGFERQNLFAESWDLITGEGFDLFENEDQGDFFGATAGLVSTALESTPFIGGLLGGGRLPAGSAWPGISTVWNALQGEYSGRKVWDVVKSELGKPFLYLAMPFGGGQLKKIYEGIEAVARGGSYSIDSEGNDTLQYPVSNDTTGDTVWNAFRATVFGKSSLPEAVEWVESGFKGLNAKQTAVYQALTDAGMGSEEAFDFMQEFIAVQKTETQSKNELQCEMLRSSELDGAARSVVYFGMLASDKERKLMLELPDNTDPGVITDLLIDLRSADDSYAKRQVLANAALTEDEMQTVYRIMMGSREKDANGKTIPDGAYVLSNNQAADLAVFEAAGLGQADYLAAMNIREDFAEQYEEDIDRELAFYQWIVDQDLTQKQADAMRSCFYSGSNTKFDEFLAAGIPEKKALSLAKTLAKLEPLPGADRVSAMQKYEAVVSSGLTGAQQMDAMAAVMSKDQYAKLEIAYDYGMAPSVYVEFLQLKDDTDTSGHKELKQLLKSLGTSDAGALHSAGGLILTKKQKAVLWQMFAGKSQDGWDNPFDRSVGKEVYAMLYPDET